MTSYSNSHIEKTGNVYDQNLVEGDFDHYMMLREDELVHMFVDQLNLSRDARYLDFACGSGRILSVIAPKFDNVTAVDVSENMVSAAREKVPGATFHLTDITKNELDIGQFDLISAFRFFGNAEDSLRRSVASALRARIKDDGYLLFNNHRNPGSLLTRLSGYHANMDFTYDKMESMLQDNGFKIVRQIPIGAWMLRHKWTLRSAWDTPVARMADRLTAIPPLARYSPDMLILAQPIT